MSKSVLDGLFSNVIVLVVAFVLISSTINLGEYLVLASTEGEEGGGDGGEEGSGDDAGEEGPAEDETEGGQGTEPRSEPPQDDGSTEDLLPAQNSACPAIAYEGSIYTDENGCPAPCPPPPSPGNLDTNVPEGCPQSTEEQVPPGTQLPEEQTALPADTPAPSTDTDKDGVPDSRDNCPSTPNTDQLDSNADGTGDACPTEPSPDEQTDVDTDGDGLLGSADNCPSASNPDQDDTDGDGEGDACDPATTGGSAEICEDGIDNDNDGVLDERVCIVSSLDGDSDGLPNGTDNCPFASNPDQKDTDGDGVGDACPELGPPVQIDTDTDGDRLLGSADNCPSYYNPVQTDTDGDGEGDVCDPVTEENTGENCRDGIDNDGDGVADGSDTGCNQVLYEPYEVTCDDGIDNDADTLTDMQDPDDCQDDTEDYGGGVPGEPPFRAPK